MWNSKDYIISQSYKIKDLISHSEDGENAFFFLEKSGLFFLYNELIWNNCKFQQFKWPRAFKKVPVSVPLGSDGVQASRIVTEHSRQGDKRNSYKVRVAAFSAIFVLFEFRWVMWSCCLSALLSLRCPPKPSPSPPHTPPPPSFFTPNCQMSLTVTSKSFWVRCCPS